jgi:hypothetical protein
VTILTGDNPDRSGSTDAMCHKRSFRLLIDSRGVVARQDDDELGKHAGFSLDVDPAAVLLDNDVMRHGEAEPCPFSSRFSSEEGIEHLLSHLGRDAGTVVANTDFDGLTKVPGGSSEDGLEGLVACLDFAPGRGIEAV